MKDVFDRYYRKYDAWYDRNRFAYLSELAAVKRKLPRTGRGLEIGVGTGRFAAPLGIKYGADPAGNMLKIAEERGVKTRACSGERLPFKGGYFDHVAIIVTLSFVRDPLKVLQEAARVLKKKGKIIIGLIDRDSFLGGYYRKKRGVFYGRARLLSVGQVTVMLKESGFHRFSCLQTVFRLPHEMKSVHKSSAGHGRGGFVVIRAEKTCS